MRVQVEDFYADWCGPCKQQEPIMEDVEEHWEDDEDVSVEKVDIDEEQEYASEHNVRAIPTVIVFRQGDEGEWREMSRFTGVTGEDDINQAVEAALEDAPEAS